jgi:hypothetical protein
MNSESARYGLDDLIHRKIGINLTDVFIMSLLQEKHKGLLFLLPSKIGSAQ